MNSLPRASQLHVPGNARHHADAARQKPPMRAAPFPQKRGMKLSVATLTVISGLSIGVVTSWALLTEFRTAGNPAPRAFSGTAIEQKPMSSEAPVIAVAPPTPAPAVPDPGITVASPPRARAIPEEPIKTGSISAAPRLTESAPAVKLAEAAVKVPELEAKPSETAAPEPAPQVRPTIAPAEADGYLAKAEAALRIGDLAVARLFFGRLAEAGDARGANGMARTYDDSELKKLPVFGLKGERAEVERWQKRARELTAKSAYARK
jgi:hypothetical protein